MHVMERSWEAGGSLRKEGSPELKAWVKRMEALICRGQALEVVAEIAYASGKAAEPRGPAARRGQRAV
jgi:hypothetical protein